MKRLSVQYTGQRDLLVFYNQLMNGMNPYGCYLKKLVDVKVDETLCPDCWDTIKISDTRYIQMAGCLYQKLASVDVTPLEFTYARNIINRFAEINDGYKVLYAMIAPLLIRDTISTVPTMAECSDVHEYSLKVQSYFNCEMLAGRVYRQREIVNLFLTGLEVDPQYHPAIKRARCLMDNGNPMDPTVPAVLRPAVLPTTIERYVSEESGSKPTIRAIQHANAQKQNSQKYHRNHESQSFNPKTSESCGICLMTGHNSQNCIPFTKYLLFRETEKSTDAASRSKLIAHYKKELRRKQDLRLKRHQLGTIRQMWQAGASFEDMESSLFKSMPDLKTAAEYSSDDDDFTVE
jgi:hypothetical protein